MTEVYCPSCGELHKSRKKICQNCFYNLESEIQTIKEKQYSSAFEESRSSHFEKTEDENVTGMEFYEQIKVAEKHRKRYGDKMLKEEMTPRSSSTTPMCDFCLCFSGGCGVGFLVGFILLLFSKDKKKK